MSSYTHRGYEHRNGGYGRRRRKSVSLRRRRKGGGYLKILLAVLGTVLAVGLVVVFFKYLKPFVDSFSVLSGDSDTDIAAPDTADVPTGSFDSVDGDVYVSDGSGYLVFNGIDRTAGNYSAVINSVMSNISADVDVYNMVVPTAYEIKLDPRLRNSAYTERDNLDRIASGLMNRIINVDVYDTLYSNRDDYIYFHTEDSWTAMGAYYAFKDFVSFVDTPDFPTEKVFPLEEMVSLKGMIKGYAGSFIDRTTSDLQPNGNKELAANLDTVEFYKLPVNYTCYSVDDNTGEEKETELYSFDTSPENAMDVFPGYSSSHLRIINHDAYDSEERLLIVKDSYGDLISGYMVSGYNQVHIIDVNGYNGNVSSYIREYDITQVLFVSSITNANNSLYCQRLRDLFDGTLAGD